MEICTKYVYTLIHPTALKYAGAEPGQVDELLWQRSFYVKF